MRLDDLPSGVLFARVPIEKPKQPHSEDFQVGPLLVLLRLRLELLGSLHEGLVLGLALLAPGVDATPATSTCPAKCWRTTTNVLK